MRRGVVIAAILGLVACAILLSLRWYDEAPKGRSKVRGTLPTMAALEHREARREERGSPDTATIVCRMGEDLAKTTLVARSDDQVMIAPVTGSERYLLVEPGEWQITLEGADGTAWGPLNLGTYELAAGDVHTCSLGLEGLAVRGRVVDQRGNPLGGAQVDACGGVAWSGEDGTFEAFMDFSAVHRGVCAARARWVDGLLARWGEAVEIHPLTAASGVELTVENTPVAGLGVSFRVQPDGVDVLDVIPGSPAERAGIVAGMTILSVDGVETIELTSEEFLDLGLGKEGSRVRLTVVGGGTVEDVEFRRERLAAMEG